MKTTITRGEYHQLLGLQAITVRHLTALRECEAAARAIIGDEDPLGSLIDDAMWDSRAVDDVLKALKIEIAAT